MSKVIVRNLIISMCLFVMSISGVNLNAESTSKSFKITDEEYNPYYEYVFTLDRQKEIIEVEKKIKKESDKIETAKIDNLRKFGKAKSISDLKKIQSEVDEKQKELKKKEKSFKEVRKMIEEIEKQEADIEKLMDKFINTSSESELKNMHDELESKIKKLNKDIDKLEKNKEYAKYFKKVKADMKKEEAKRLKNLK